MGRKSAMLVEFECPECKGHVCEIWGLNGSNLGIRLLYWHMLLNPGLAFNELVCGQRTPENMYVCKSCTTSFVDRSYVHCPGCDSFHAGRIWSYTNAFGHWLGLVCPTCGGAIPCQWNFTSRVVLALTAPIWWFPVKQMRRRILQSQHRRIVQTKDIYIDKAAQAPKKVSYIQMGLLFGGIMGLIFAVINPAFNLIWHNRFSFEALINSMFVTLPLMLLVTMPGGLIFGFTMRYFLDRKGDRNLHLTFHEDGTPASLETQDRSDSGLSIPIKQVRHDSQTVD